MKVVLVLCVFLGISAGFSYRHRANSDDDFDQEWIQFKLKHHRRYATRAEEMKRMKIFVDNLKLIRAHNRLHFNGQKSFKMELNHLSDKAPEELFTGFRPNQDSESSAGTFLAPMNIDELPDHVDWRSEGLVTDVQDQGVCMSCYAFSAVGAIEGQQARKSGKLVPLSVQNVIDCSVAYGDNQGCHGGWMHSVFQYAIENNGIDTSESYPYEGKDGECRFKNETTGAVVKNYVKIQSGNEEALKVAVATVGPVSVAIDAAHPSFGPYKSGVFEEPTCGNTMDDLTHAMLVVGYGTEDGKDYWLIKNSMGADWGDSGYMKILRNKNHCGIATYALYPLV